MYLSLSNNIRSLVFISWITLVPFLCGNAAAASPDWIALSGRISELPKRRGDTIPLIVENELVPFPNIEMPTGDEPRVALRSVLDAVSSSLIVQGTALLGATRDDEEWFQGIAMYEATVRLELKCSALQLIEVHTLQSALGALLQRYDLVRALPYAKKAIEGFRGMGASDHPRLGYAQYRLGWILNHLEKDRNGISAVDVVTEALARVRGEDFEESSPERNLRQRFALALSSLENVLDLKFTPQGHLGKGIHRLFLRSLAPLIETVAFRTEPREEAKKLTTFRLVISGPNMASEDLQRLVAATNERYISNYDLTRTILFKLFEAGRYRFAELFLRRTLHMGLPGFHEREILDNPQYAGEAVLRRYMLAETLRLQERDDESRIELNQAIREERSLKWRWGSQWLRYQEIGSLFYLLHRFDLARKYFSLALRHGHGAQVLGPLSEISEREGRVSDAILYLNRLLPNLPSHESQAAEARARLSRLRDRETLIGYCARAIREFAGQLWRR